MFLCLFNRLVLNMREIILDSETTGLSPERGDRIIEIGAIEVVDKVKTGKFFHKFINPEREVSKSAFNIHGISDEFLKDKPKFYDVVDDFLRFIAEDKLIIHNAPFDMKFINNELSIFNKGKISYERAVDTLVIARRKFPGSPANLDALCKRFNISTEIRKAKGHGALLDSELLYEVYIRLTEGVQSEFFLKKASALNNTSANLQEDRKYIEPRKFSYEDDLKKHKEFLEKIPNNLWVKS
ncbi:MAG: DNA polymerase III subunit epsilon [Rickettsiales bacterium]|nr:DNA polymerase III subunit epsilon [Rickettsiales bacterium]